MDGFATAMPTRRLLMPCEEPGCDLPCAYIERGILIIHSHHHGKKHVSRWSVADLLAQMAPPPAPPAGEKGPSHAG